MLEPRVLTLLRKTRCGINDNNNSNDDDDDYHRVIFIIILICERKEYFIRELESFLLLLLG